MREKLLDPGSASLKKAELQRHASHREGAVLQQDRPSNDSCSWQNGRASTTFPYALIMTSPINFCLPAVDDGCLSDVLCPAVFACGPVTEQSIPGLDLLFSLRGEVRGKYFLESVADVCALSHWLESFQGTHTKGLPKGQVSSGQKKAVPAGQGEQH